jgi:caffeoyl-CoA O-methyltransferase
MSLKSIGLSDELHAYLLAHNPGNDDVVQDLLAETMATLPEYATMPIALEQASFLTFVTRLIGARRAVEIGTFTGLSSLAIARGLPPDGRLVCFDISAEFTTVARRYWDRAGVADRIELRLGDATRTVATLPEAPELDLAFIDADKSSYPLYWEAVIPRMRPGGLVLVDNVLQAGHIVDPRDENVRTVAAFNDMVLADARVEAVMLPLADGLTLARRKGASQRGTSEERTGPNPNTSARRV